MGREDRRAARGVRRGHGRWRGTYRVMWRKRRPMISGLTELFQTETDCFELKQPTAPNVSTIAESSHNLSRLVLAFLESLSGSCEMVRYSPLRPRRRCVAAHCPLGRRWAGATTAATGAGRSGGAERGCGKTSGADGNRKADRSDEGGARPLHTTPPPACTF
jgi:hypothetical protein